MEQLLKMLHQEGEYWRVYLFIEGAATYDLVENNEDFYQSAVAFGHFQGLLADYPAETLHETIVNFHNTVDRFAKFKKALDEDVMGRAKDVQEEIKFVLDREPLAHVLCDLLAEKKIPLRVTHNDTKFRFLPCRNYHRRLRLFVYSHIRFPDGWA